MEGHWCRTEHREDTSHFKFLSDPAKWLLMFDHISLTKQSCRPLVWKPPRAGIKKPSPGFSPVFPEHCHQDIFSSWDPGCPFSLRHSLRFWPSRPPPLPHVVPCATAQLEPCLCVCECTHADVCTHLPGDRKLYTGQGRGWAFIPLVTLSSVLACLGSLIRQLKSSYLGLMSPPARVSPFFPPHRPRLVGLLASPSVMRETWLFSGSLSPVFFLLPLPGSPGLPPSLNYLLPLWCLLRPFLAYQLICNTLAFYLDSFFPFPFNCPYSQICKNPYLNVSLLHQ